MLHRFFLSILLPLAASSNGIAAEQHERPNVILFIGDDISFNDFGCYGNQSARTPQIDALARRGMRFANAFLTASSCSPSRCSIVTGRYPHNLGQAAELHGLMAWHLPQFPALLRESGYYTVLSGKNHMPLRQAPPGESAQQPFEKKDHGRIPTNSGGHANWVKLVQERPRDRPFFFWFAAFDAHRDWDADDQWDPEKYGPKHRPEDVIVPPFLADTESTRQDLASYYNEVTRYDYYIGQVVAELQKQNALDNTLILVMADNGRPFPRAKTRLHDSGMKTAFVAHWPARIKPSKHGCDSLVSSIDLAPTILELAGVKVPETMQGVSLLPLFADPEATVREYAFSEHNWHDYEAYGRSVRTRDYLYITNRRPRLAWQGPADSVRSPSHQDLLVRRNKGQLTPAQADVFLTPRPDEEFYDAGKDQHQLTNLMDDSDYASEIDRLRGVLARWQDATGDTVPEQLSIDKFDRETGENLLKPGVPFRRTTPGEERHAASINAPGPR